MDQNLEREFKKRIECLRSRLQMLLGMEPTVSGSGGENLEAEKRAIRMALAHYAAVLEMEGVIEELELYRKRAAN